MSGKAQLLAGEWHLFLGGLQAKVKDPSALLKAAFMTAGFKDIIEHFADEKGPSGKWKPRSAATQAQYAMKSKSNARYNPSNKLLQLTGNLRKSILPGNTKKISYNAIEIWANSVYGHRHDSGTYGIPQRQFMWFSDKSQGLMANIISSIAFGVK